MLSIYLNFLCAIETLDGPSAQHSLLDELSKKLLEVIVLKHQQGNALNVSDAMLMSHIASSATLHKRINLLLNGGWIQQVFYGKDRRRKYLIPTAITYDFFLQMDELIEQVFKSSAK